MQNAAEAMSNFPLYFQELIFVHICCLLEKKAGGGVGEVFLELSVGQRQIVTLQLLLELSTELPV